MMPANAIIDQVGGVNSQALSLLPYLPLDIGQNYKAGPFWTCERIDFKVGAEPGTAICKIPLATGLDEAAPTVAAVVGGPTPAVGLTGIVRAINGSGTYNVVFRGTVTKVSHEFDSGMDYATFILSDARWNLKGVPIVGSYWHDGSAYARYRVGWALRPNEGGEPNAIWSDAAGIFVMCEPRHGLDVGDTPPVSHAFSTSQACYWEPWMVAGHMRYVVTTPDRATYPEAGILPEGIIWPDGMHNLLDVEDSPRARDESYMGKNVADALQDLCDEVGRQGLTIDFSDEEKPTLSIVRTRYIVADDENGPGTYILRPVSGGDLGDAKMTVAGSLVEDASNLFTRVTLAGAPVVVERRASMSGSQGMLKAWTDTEKEALSGFIHARMLSGVRLDEAVRLGLRKYPDVFGAFRLDPDWNFASGLLAVSGKGLAAVGRPILDSLLTSYLSSGDEDNRQQFRRPVLWEYLPDSSTNWRPAIVGDMTVDARGTIRINSIRDASDGFDQWQTFTAVASGLSTSGLASITGNNMRATFAIPHDYRLTQTVRHPSDYNEDTVPAEEFDADRVAGSTGRHAYVMASKDFAQDGDRGQFRQEWRYGSWPIPETVNDSVVAEDAANPYLDDSSDILKAAKRRAQKLCRLRRGGALTIPRLCTTWRLGTPVNAIEYNGGRWPLRSVITSLTLNNQPTKQYTAIGFD
jgi:hypothetical protein